MNIFQKLIKRKYPQYDTKRYYFNEGDCVTLPTKEQVVLTSTAITTFEGVVVKRGFKFKEAGAIVTLNIDELPYIGNDDKKAISGLQFKYKLLNSCNWKAGEVIQIDNRHFLLTTSCLYVESKSWLAYCIHEQHTLDRGPTEVYYSFRYVKNPYDEYIIKR